LSRNSSPIPRGLRSESDADGSAPAKREPGDHLDPLPRKEPRPRELGGLLGPDEVADGTESLRMISSFAFVLAIGSLQRVVHGRSNKFLSALACDRRGGFAGTCLTRLESIYGSSKRNPANAGE
jgi:hypothetical protein